MENGWSLGIGDRKYLGRLRQVDAPAESLRAAETAAWTVAEQREAVPGAVPRDELDLVLRVAR